MFMKFMKRVIGIVAVFLVVSPLFAQRVRPQADDILGIYSANDRSMKDNYHLNFYKNEEGDYEARIIWMEQANDNLGKPRTDVKNRHVEQRHIPLSEMVIVRGLRFDARSGEWEGGRVYDPSTGKTYRCFIEFKSDTLIKMKGYVGFRMFGKSLYWSKLSE